MATTKSATKKAPTKAAVTRAKNEAAVARAEAAEAKAETKATKTRAEVVKEEARRLAQYGGGFMNFIREQGVIGLAVGLAIGTAAGASVKVIVDQLISPVVALLTRGVDLNSLKWVLIAADPAKKQAEVAIGWGAILSSLITLLATALVVYLAIHLARLDRLDKKKES